VTGEFLLHPVGIVRGMNTETRTKLAAIMARMATGDAAAAVTLYLEFGDAIRNKVARVARSQGATHLTADDLDGLTMEVCLDLVPRAGSWDPDGGALPWVWAERRIVSRVAAFVGQYGVSYDEGAPPSSCPSVEDVAFVGDDSGEDEVLDRLASWSSECALLRDALGVVASVSHRRVFLMFSVQRDSGDPSPSATVAGALGVTPDNVRQIAHRVRARLLRLASSDPAFGALATLPLLGGEATAA
jgi:hypothetical protein